MIPRTDLLPFIAQYRAGLEAEIVVLRRLATLAAREREVVTNGPLADLHDVIDQRDRLMASLVAIESQLRPTRDALAEARHQLQHLAPFQELASLHDEATSLAREIIASDDHSRTALHQAELARRFAAESLEKGETTLAAYRRVVTPLLANATLVNRRG